MNPINLFLEIYCEEKKEQGLVALRRLLSQTQEAELTVFSVDQWQRHDKETGVVRISRPFNVVQGTLRFGDQNARVPHGVIDVRYRPAISSKIWANLDFSMDRSTLDQMATRISSESDHETFEFQLSLKSFEGSSRSRGSMNMAVFEALCHSVSSADSFGKTLLKTLGEICPELLAQPCWGYADIVPFRDLSLEEEWEVARTGVLWADLAATADVQHQHLFIVSGAKPSVPVPNQSVREGLLTLYDLPRLE